MPDPSDDLPSGHTEPPVYKLISVFVGAVPFPDPSLIRWLANLWCPVQEHFLPAAILRCSW